jgi:hypothetical protein
MKNTTHKLKRIFAFTLILVGFSQTVNGQTNFNEYRPFYENDKFTNSTTTTDIRDLSSEKGQFLTRWSFDGDLTVTTNSIMVNNQTFDTISGLVIVTESQSNYTSSFTTERFVFQANTNNIFSFAIRQRNASGGNSTLTVSIVDDSGFSPIQGNNTLLVYDLSNASANEVRLSINNTTTISGSYRLEFNFNNSRKPNQNHSYLFSNLQTDLSLLPVTYANLEAKQVLEGVQVKWTTSEEINNSHFNIERSTDGENWDILGTVDGIGNSHQEVDYSFMDYNPANGLNLYRLEQVDFDGKSAHSDVMAVLVANAEKAPDLQLFPNPSTGQVSVQGIPYETIRVRNLSGKLLYEHKAQSKHDLQFLDKGIYFIEVVGLDANVSRHKFLKD